jgi:hypothetical protein
MNKNKIEITGDMDLGAYSPLELSESQETNNSSKLTMSKLSKMIAESIQTHLVDVLGKYTAGKTSSEQANKAIMDLANSSIMNERNNRGFSDYAREYAEKNGENLPDDVLKSAAKKNDDRFHGRQVKDGKYSYVPQRKDYNSKMGRLNETVDKDMEEHIRKTVRQMLKSGELPDGKDSYHGNEMAEWYDKILKKALDRGVDEVGNDLNVMTSVIDDEFGKWGGNYDLKNEPNHKKYVDSLLKKIVNESLEDEMLVWEQRDNSEFGQILKQLEHIAEDGLIDAGSIINHLRTEYALDGNMQATTRSVIHYLREYDFISADEKGENINIENSNSPEAAQLCIKLKELSQHTVISESVNELSNDTIDNAYMKVMNDVNTLPYGTPKRVRRDAQLKNIKKMRDDRLGFDPIDMSIMMRKQGTSGNPSVDRKWARWQQNHNDRVAGKRRYDDKTGKWMTHIDESYAQEGNYTHFAVNKATNKIVNGWDYTGYDPEELKLYKRDYFIADLEDYGLDPKQYTIITRVGCKKRGINPDDDSQFSFKEAHAF